jgi:hypothetical protein
VFTGIGSGRGAIGFEVSQRWTCPSFPPAARTVPSGLIAAEPVSDWLAAAGPVSGGPYGRGWSASVFHGAEVSRRHAGA